MISKNNHHCTLETPTRFEFHGPRYDHLQVAIFAFFVFKYRIEEGMKPSLLISA